MADYNQNLGQEIGWEDEISEEGGEFRLLEPGDYPFTVVSFERKRFPGSARMCACNQVALKLDVDGVTVEDSLFLNKKTEWTLSQFFVAIGQKQKGVPFRPNWSAICGASGVCRVGVRTWTGKDGEERKSNEVKEYYAPDSDAARAQAVPSTPAAPAQQTTMAGYAAGNPGHWQPGKF